MSSEMTNILLLGGLVVGGYYLYSTGMLDSILGGFGPPPQEGPVVDQFESDAEEGGGDKDEEKKDKKRY